VHHHRSDRRQAATPDWQTPSVGPPDGETAPGVLEHLGGQVDADGDPAQLAGLGGADAGATSDVKTDAVLPGQEVTQDAGEVEGVDVACPSTGAMPAEVSRAGTSMVSPFGLMPPETYRGQGRWARYALNSARRYSS
jgi:hypothetical protein